MAHQVIDMKCPGCGAPTSTGETTCKYCHRPVIISTFNSVYSMPLPEVNKYAGAYRKALSENPDSMELNNSVVLWNWRRRPSCIRLDFLWLYTFFLSDGDYYSIYHTAGQKSSHLYYIDVRYYFGIFFH